MSPWGLVGPNKGQTNTCGEVGVIRQCDLTFMSLSCALLSRDTCKDVQEIKGMVCFAGALLGGVAFV